MTAAARHARSGAVTVAARQAMTTAGPCEPGDVLGVIEGDFVVVGDDLFGVATDVLERLLGGGGELVTLVAGAERRRPRRAVRVVPRRPPPDRRRRRLRRRAAALPAAGRCRVGPERPHCQRSTWDSKLAAVAGKGATKIEKAFGYRTVGDLLQHYPRRWVDKGSLCDLGAIEPDEHVTVIARVVRAKQHPYRDRRRGGMAYRLEVVVATERRRSCR